MNGEEGNVVQMFAEDGEAGTKVLGEGKRTEEENPEKVREVRVFIFQEAGGRREGRGEKARNCLRKPHSHA